MNAINLNLLNTLNQINSRNCLKICVKLMLINLQKIITKIKITKFLKSKLTKYNK